MRTERSSAGLSRVIQCILIIRLVRNEERMSIQPLILSFSPLTVELPAAGMRPPGSASYPVQASRQLHDAKLVPVCNGHSPIKEQRPGASSHPQDRSSLQSISSAKYHLSSLDLLRLILHFVCSLSCIFWERDATVAVVVLSYISPPLLYLLCMSQWNPTPSVPGMAGGRPLTPGTRTYRRAASKAESAHPAEM